MLTFFVPLKNSTWNSNRRQFFELFLFLHKLKFVEVPCFEICYVIHIFPNYHSVFWIWQFVSNLFSCLIFTFFSIFLDFSQQLTSLWSKTQFYIFVLKNTSPLDFKKKRSKKWVFSASVDTLLSQFLTKKKSAVAKKPKRLEKIVKIRQEKKVGSKFDCPSELLLEILCVKKSILSNLDMIYWICALNSWFLLHFLFVLSS